MDKFIIEGGNKLTGEVVIGGAKNAALPIMAASLLTSGETILKNVPNLVDIKTMCLVLETLGAKIERKNSLLRIETSSISNYTVPYELMRRMRASFIILGPLLIKFGMANVSLPGGCAIGSRSVNLHLKGFEKLGAEIILQEGYVMAKGQLKGGTIYLDYPSVGATENLLMAAVLTPGITTIENAAREPEVVDLANFLNKMGAKIKGVGTEMIQIKGIKELKPVEYSIMPDRIETATYIVAAVITGGEIDIIGGCPEYLAAFLNKLSQAGIDFLINENQIKVKSRKEFLSLKIKTLPYPGFPTDIQPLMTALLSLANGTSIIAETVFEDRFIYVAELSRMGASIIIEGENVIITGVSQLKGANVMASDIRGGVALVLASLAANGKSTVSRIYHIDRGYEKLEEKLTYLGANVKRTR